MDYVLCATTDSLTHQQQEIMTLQTSDIVVIGQARLWPYQNTKTTMHGCDALDCRCEFGDSVGEAVKMRTMGESLLFLFLYIHEYIC